ncbi:MAG: putative metal-binding motif-containing protein [Myxococcales bacterium]|nr:putative metal-binding motif-containing protein [Myxococcales bacterium]
MKVRHGGFGGVLGFALVALAVGAACGSNSNEGKLCNLGDSRSCLGPADCKGTQSCIKNGLAFGPCSCGSNTGGAAGMAGSGGGGVGGVGGTSTGGTGNVPACTPTGTDADGDCFGEADGDCDDKDPNVNPGAVDYAGNGVDEDCSGTADDFAPCDSTVTSVADPDPLNGARALGVCQTATLQDKKWGVIQAKWVMADGKTGMNDKSHGLLPSFGTNVLPREGSRVLALSSGTAREAGDADYQPVSGASMGTKGQAPPGFPIDSPTCKVITEKDKTTNDPAALELSIRVPSNAKSLLVDFNYYTYEFPQYVCTKYNDFFVALQFPAPKNAQSGNIAFDGEGNPVSVNNAYLRACKAQSAGGKQFDCPLGVGLLDKTGFDQSAATGWLVTQSPVTPRSIVTLRFAIWDMGDAVLDSTVLLDNLRFSPDEVTQAATNPAP